ncbi:MAG: MurR/RpiR family transcriptional regulator [Mesorhizobium sp.]
MENETTVRELLANRNFKFTPSEDRIARLLLADYPMAGFGTASSIARRAGVSDPTVARMIAKLGFQGYAEFQARLLSEVEMSLHSPLLMMETKRAKDSEKNPVLSYLKSVEDCFAETGALTPLHNYERSARLIMDAKGDVLLLGGRFSRYLAGMLASYLSQFRRGVHDISQLSSEAFDRLVDLGSRDVLVVFDYRRYQLDVISFARQAAANGTPVVLFTDQWHSPIAEMAQAIIISPLDVASPYDTLAPSIAQMEALVALILSSNDKSVLSRIERLEAVREENAVTADSRAPAARSKADLTKPKPEKP